jgi:outer membrane protein OmpA-like peptidoglycan-associated protein
MIFLRRANSTIQYIKKELVPIRILGKGFGESELKEAVKCTEDEHALNRRSV